MVIVRKATVDEITSDVNFSSLHAEYAAESAINGLPAPTDKMEMYRQIENTSMFQAFAAYNGGWLVGFAAVLTPIVPHYGIGICVMESLFVGKAYRKKGAPGLKLIHAAEEHGRQAGAPGLLISAPSEGVLASVLPHMGYRETNRIFFKALSL